MLASVRAATIVGGRVRVAERPDPDAGEGQILVRVRAAGLNGADVLQRRGAYPPPAGAPPDIPGLELAGEVVAAGRGARRFSVGDRVMSITGGGAQAELAVVHEREAMPVPGRLGWEEAGAFPEAFTTAHDALFTQAGLAMGERVCVHGGAGGVGTAAVQLARRAGARVVATVRDRAHRESVAALGATAVDPAEAEAHGPYDVVLALVGGPNRAANLRALALGGRIAVVGVGAGTRTEIDLLQLMAKRCRIHGSTLRSRALEAKAAAARQVESHVLPLLGSAEVRVPIDAVYGLTDAAAAYARFEAGGKFGKIVLTMP